MRMSVCPLVYIPTTCYCYLDLRSSMSHIERLSQLNFKTLLSELPQGNDIRLTGHGRIIRKLDADQNTRNNKGQRKPIQKGSPVVVTTVNRAPVTSAVLIDQVSQITNYSDMVCNAAGITPRNPPVQPPMVRTPGMSAQTTVSLSSYTPIRIYYWVDTSS